MGIYSLSQTKGSRGLLRPRDSLSDSRCLNTLRKDSMEDASIGRVIILQFMKAFHYVIIHCYCCACLKVE